jgi:prepilin-type N-terminal cleavage/methylation domain-containing protein
MFKKTKIQRGVTLIELMVVVVLIGVLAGIASPGISRAIERQNAVAVAAGVASALRTARNQAMSRGTPVWVTINFGNNAANRGSIQLFTQGTVAAGTASRNCREFLVQPQVEVGSWSPADISGKGAIVRVEPNASICFSPDGRVLSQTGQMLTPSTNRCRGAYANIFTADFDIGALSLPLLECPADTAALQAQRDDRAISRMHQVSVPFNGAIRVEQ